MSGYFTPEEVAAQLRQRRPLAKCRHEDRRTGLKALIQQDIARLICGASDTNYFSYLITKRGELALVIGARGDRDNRIVTLELIRQRRRIAYFCYSDPRLGLPDRRQRLAGRDASSALRILSDEGSLTHLITMRTLLYGKLPWQGRVLTLAAD